MLETATDSSVQKAKSLESEINENTNPCVLPVNNTENQASVPDFVHAILLRVAGTDLGDKLTSLLNEKHTELVKCQAQCEYAQKEANDAKNRLSRIEMELDDVRSAAALTVAGQSDMISNIQRHYEEDLASWRSISEQQVAEVRAASQAELDRAKADWDSERKALVIRASSNYNFRRDSCNLASAGKGPVEVCRTVSNFDHVNSADIRLRDSPANELPKAPVNGYEVDSKKLSPRLQNQVSEVPPLHQLLASSPKSSPLGSTAELDLGPCQGSPKHNLMTGTIGAAVTPSVPKNVHTSQTESPAPADGPVTSNCDFKSPVSESSWVQMQSGLKETESRSPVACAMCSNYEHQLQTVQLGLQEKDKALQKSQEESLAKSVQLDSALQRQAELEKELQSRTTSQSEKIEKLETTITRMSSRVENLLSNYRAHRLATEEKLRQLSDERQTLQSNFNTLQLHYDRLLGRRLMASTKLAAQPIHLPSDRSELELFALKTYEENLSLREAREQLDEQLKSDAQFHRQQLTAERQEKVNMETSLQRELDDTRARLASLTDVVSQRDNEMAGRQKAEEEAKEAKIKLEELQARVEKSESEASEARAQVVSLQQRLVCLQSDLDKMESVQADFVRLSQNLQVQLERLRQQDQEVRWVDADDVTACYACNTVFPPGNSRKHHCRHCGKVHCIDCLSQTVSCGPASRPARVCSVCYTLLNKHVAPYFSTSFQDPSTGTQVRSGSPRQRPNRVSSTLSPQANRTKSTDA